MYTKYLVLFLFITIQTFAQESVSERTIDSLRLENKYNSLLNSKDPDKLPLLSLQNVVDPYEISFDSNFLDYSQGNLTELNSMAMKQIQTDMAQSFAIYRKGQNKYHLGVVSDILGYMSTAAAAGLAAYHLVKYKKKYGIK